MDKAALFYDYDECVKKFVGICVKQERKRIEYDLTKPEVRKELIDMGFTATSERRWQ